ncbi:peroxidase 2-like [Jatropha curcas]|uniref:peroxidase 2-like n=1 Tax=Jatropha curcas TaxID=180498 RepID=UPI001892F5B6|nr:peroxidase 2-like [Jatropha curcas]
MASRMSLCLLLVLVASATASAQLCPHFYDIVCPDALPTIKRVVEAAVSQEQRMGASLLRLHFHDCFVNRVDEDVEARVVPAQTSFNCCMSRDSVVVLGGPTWKVPLGRKDSTTANKTKAETDLPGPFLDLPALIDAFKKQGLNETDLVALSGGHTIGFSQCGAFRDRIYNETNIDPEFAQERRLTCPRTGNNTNLAPFDPTPASFDVAYFNSLTNLKGLLHSDQQLFNGGSTDALVSTYSSNPEAFRADFIKSMIRMGNIKPLTGNEGEVRSNCRVVNVNQAVWEM